MISQQNNEIKLNQINKVVNLLDALLRLNEDTYRINEETLIIVIKRRYTAYKGRDINYSD